VVSKGRATAYFLGQKEMDNNSVKSYRRVSRGLNKNYLIPFDDKYWDEISALINKNPDDDYYESIFEYNQEHKDKYDKTKSVAGSTGLKTSRIIFDFDNANDMNAAKSDASELCARLLKEGIPQDGIRCFFSGSKGFHVEIDTNEKLTKKEVDNIVANFAKDLGTLDQKIRDEQRVIRLPLTKHQKTGLYKIPLTVEEMTGLGIDDIQQKAHALFIQDETEYEEMLNLWSGWRKVELPTNIKNIKNLNKEEFEVFEDNIALQDSPDFSKKPPHLSATKFALQEGFFGDGERNEACMILASTYKHLGYNKELAYNMLKATLRLRAKRLGHKDYDKEELWNTIINIVYSENWRGGTYSEANNSLLRKLAETYNIKEQEEKLFKTPSDVSTSALTFINNLEENRVYTGIESLDENLVLTRGMMVGVLGAPAGGKTSLANMLAEYTSLHNNGVLYVSADMSEDLLGIRMLGKYSGKSMKDIENILKEKDLSELPENHVIRQAEKEFHVSFQNVLFTFKTGLNVETLKSVLMEAKIANPKLTLVIIDYLEKIRGPYQDATANGSYVASNIADMAKELNVCIVLMLQPQKAAGDPSEALLSYTRIKGSAVISQDCRAVLTIWRPGFDPATAHTPDNLDKYTCLAIVKQNMGSLGKFDFKWDPIRGTITELTSKDMPQYEQDMQLILSKREAKNGSEDLY
jgi:replicative DNA helicase